jgi:hypothetical protein
MDLSDRERRLLAEIERNLRGGDRAFACRFDALNAVPPRRGPQRFACYVSRLEVVCLLLVVLVLTVLSVLFMLTAGRTPPPSPPPARPPGTAAGHLVSSAPRAGGGWTDWRRRPAVLTIRPAVR